ncbi:MAG TPA: zinc-ribbon domain-containing protein [Acidimicrobiales bacterium]
MGRSGQRCHQCGAGVPDEAVYCPACGTATGNLKFEGLESGALGPAADVSLGSPRRRWLAPVAVVAVAAVVVGVFVVGGQGGGTTAPTTTVPPTTAPPTTVTPSTSSTAAAPTTTTSVYSSTSAGRPLEPEADGVVVYLGVRSDEVARVDLGTGTVERRLLERPGGPWMALGRQGGVVLSSARGDQSDVYALADGPASTPQSIATWEDSSDGGSLSPQAAPATEPDEVWVWHEGGPDGITVRRVRVDGTVTAGPVALPKFSTLLAADGPGALLLGGPDGLYRATIDGQTLAIEHVWPRVPVVVTPTAFLDMACSSGLECHLAVVDRVTGDARPVPTPAEELFNGYYYAFTASDALSPDGHWLAHLQYSGQTPHLVVYDLVNEGIAVDHPIIGSFYGGIHSLPFSFSPDGRLLLFIDSTGQLGVWPVGRGELPHMLHIPGVEAISSMSVLPSA